MIQLILAATVWVAMEAAAQMEAMGKEETTAPAPAADTAELHAATPTAITPITITTLDIAAALAASVMMMLISTMISLMTMIWTRVTSQWHDKS